MIHSSNSQPSWHWEACGSWSESLATNAFSRIAKKRHPSKSSSKWSKSSTPVKPCQFSTRQSPQPLPTSRTSNLDSTLKSKSARWWLWHWERRYWSWCKCAIRTPFWFQLRPLLCSLRLIQCQRLCLRSWSSCLFSKSLRNTMLMPCWQLISSYLSSHWVMSKTIKCSESMFSPKSTTSWWN